MSSLTRTDTNERASYRAVELAEEECVIYVNRLVCFGVSAFAFCAWVAFYNIFTIRHRPIFVTGGVVLAVTLLATWHYNHLKYLKESLQKLNGVAPDSSEATAPLNSPRSPRVHNSTEATGKGESGPNSPRRERKPVYGMLVEKTFCNLTDAMGFVSVESWKPHYQDFMSEHHYLTFGYGFAGVWIVIFILEMIERKATGAAQHVFDILGQVYASAAAWFLSEPVVGLYQFYAEVSDKDPVGWDWAMLSLFVAGAVITVSNTVADKVFHADGKEEASDPASTMFAEKALYLLKNSLFYSSARLIKQMILQYSWVHDNMTEFVLLFIVLSALVVMILHQMQKYFINKRAKEKGANSASTIFRKKIAGEYITITTRTLSWMVACFIDQAIPLDKLPSWTPGHRVRWFFVAVFFQIASLCLEVFRMHHIKTRMVKPHVKPEVETAVGAEGGAGS